MKGFIRSAVYPLQWMAVKRAGGCQEREEDVGTDFVDGDSDTEW